jgi:riboflavin kinase/FMN adenylyltransferase
VLVEHLHAAQVVVGENFTYGHRAAGTVDTLRAEGRRFGFAVEGVPLAGVAKEDDGPDDEVTISSTYIRACVAAGDMASAAAALGRPHRVDGVVVRGHRRGRELGYPTANVETPPFQGSRRTVEAYVLDFEGDLYGEHVGVEFTQRLRPMTAFADVDELLAAMAKDVTDTRIALGLPS